MKNIKIIVIILLNACIAVCLSGFVWAVQDGIAIAAYRPATYYVMLVNEQKVGVVKSAVKGLVVYDDVVERVIGCYAGEVFVDSSVYFKETTSNHAYITSDSELAQAIERAIVVKTHAYALTVNGKKLCYVKDPGVVQEVLQHIKDSYAQAIQQDGTGELQEIFFKEKITYQPESVAFSRVVDRDKVISILTQGAEGIKEYEVEEGKTPWSIAKTYSIPFSIPEQANAAINIDMIPPGDNIKLDVEKQLVTVVTKEKCYENREIPFETEIREDNTLEKGKARVIRQGRNGQKEVVSLITKENGKEVNREVLEERIIAEPVKKIVVKGTRIVPATTASSVTRGSARGGDVTAFAKQFLGRPYVWGADGPNAFDCSGFTTYVFRHFGIYLPRTAYSQRSVGIAVPRENLAPGDLVLFTNPNHVGIYIGEGQFIHAASGSKMSVCISNLNSTSYARRYVGARRVLK